MKYRIEIYVHDGKAPFVKWFDELDPATAARVDRSVRRMEAGNFGAAKSLHGGLFELRLNFGPGYRVYYGIKDMTLIILLSGGDKHRQSADIAAARIRWENFLEGGK
jgi:putative addiction module killer protein